MSEKLVTPANGGVAQVRTADQGYFFGVTIAPPTSSSASSPLTGNNQVVVYQFVLPFTCTVTRISLQATTGGGAGKLMSVGIYDRLGTTRLINSGTYDANSTNIQTNTITSVTLNPGIYHAAFTCDSSTVAMRCFAAAAGIATLMNANSVKKAGTAANSSTAGVLPATLGDITAVTAQTFPAVIFEP